MAEYKDLRKDILMEMEEKIQPFCRHIKSQVSEGTGFAVMLFRFDGDEASFGSNCRREDMIRALRELANVMEKETFKPPMNPPESLN